MHNFIITKVRNNSSGVILTKENTLDYINDIFSFYSLDSEDRPYSIYEVKRVSDGAIFTCDDKVKLPNGAELPIKGFNIDCKINAMFTSCYSSLDDVTPLYYTNIEEHRVHSMFGNDISTVTYKGDGDPVSGLDEYIKKKYYNVKYKEYIDINMDDPWTRILVFEKR